MYHITITQEHVCMSHILRTQYIIYQVKLVLKFLMLYTFILIHQVANVYIINGKIVYLKFIRVGIIYKSKKYKYNFLQFSVYCTKI